MLSSHGETSWSPALGIGPQLGQTRGGFEPSAALLTAEGRCRPHLAHLLDLPFCWAWTMTSTCCGMFYGNKVWSLCFPNQFWGYSIGFARSYTESILKRKTRILQAYLLLLYSSMALQRRISPIATHAGGRNVITAAFSTEKLLKAFPFLGTMVCVSLQCDD